jgi:hypothetical protein
MAHTSLRKYILRHRLRGSGRSCPWTTFALFAGGHWQFANNLHRMREIQFDEAPAARKRGKNAENLNDAARDSSAVRRFSERLSGLSPRRFFHNPAFERLSV